MSELHIKITNFIKSDFGDFISEVDVFQSLKEFDALYAGEVDGEESPITDGQYDALYLYAKQLNPAHKYFTGVGSQVRGGKIDLPFEMGSLNQVPIGSIQDWVIRNNLSNKEHVVSDKMDGTSTMLIYDASGDAQIAYSRGDGVQGADWTRHIFKIKGVPTNCKKVLDSGLNVRAEVELTETAFKALYDAGIRRRGGQPYKNSRNMVAGLMNSKTIPDVCYEHLSVITYEVLGLPVQKKMQLKLLEANGFQVVKYSIIKGSKLTDGFLAKFLKDRKVDLDYEIDGVVIEVNDILERQRMNPTKETLNPGYAIKYKVADASNQAIATVKGVTWNISKHGYLKPQVNIEPVELVGVTISNATGFNAKFIINNLIGPGAKVRITRSGDVIPFITDVVLGAKMASMPTEDCRWNETGVDLVLKNKEDNNEVAIQQTLDFFSSIEAPHLKEGTVRKMFEAQQYASAHSAIGNMLIHTEVTWKRTIGENGTKIYNGIRKKFTNMPLHVLMGSLPFFGRGVGKRKFKKLEIALGTNALRDGNFSLGDIVGVGSFEAKSAAKIISGIKEYLEFYKKLPDYVTIATMEDKSGGSLSGQKICMTGFRDKDMVTAIEAAGGDVQSTVSGNTTLLVCKDPTSNSGKVKKAKDKGVKVISIGEMEDILHER